MIRIADHCPEAGRLLLTRIKATGDDATGRKNHLLEQDQRARSPIEKIIANLFLTRSPN